MAETKGAAKAAKKAPAEKKVVSMKEATAILYAKRNDELRPIPKGTKYTVTSYEGSGKKATVKCSKHGEWINTFGNLVGRHSSLCPGCSKEVRAAAAAITKKARDEVKAAEKKVRDEERAVAKAEKDAAKLAEKEAKAAEKAAAKAKE